MDQGQSTYGMSNLEYDLITTLSNLLEGIEALERYALDADQAGDQESATAFRTLRENNRSSVQQLRGALSRRLNSSA